MLTHLKIKQLKKTFSKAIQNEMKYGFFFIFFVLDILDSWMESRCLWTSGMKSANKMEALCKILGLSFRFLKTFWRYLDDFKVFPWWFREGHGLFLSASKTFFQRRFKEDWVKFCIVILLFDGTHHGYPGRRRACYYCVDINFYIIYPHCSNQ